MGSAGRHSLPIVWSAAFSTATGYGEEARTTVSALDDAGYDVRLDPIAWSGWEVPLASGRAERIERLLLREPPERFVHVVHATPHSFFRHESAAVRIGRTMHETDNLPAEWVARCGLMDEIWVPSDFNVETFARAGVERAKLRAMPQGLDARLFHDVTPAPIPGAEGFTFLALLGWARRKGWDVLVRAFLEEFDRGDGVTLALLVPPRDWAKAHAQLVTYTREELGRDLAGGPRVVLAPVHVSDVELPRLYAGADAFVLPSRGEGWGRPQMEAMASGLPTIATRWSGVLEFMHDGNSFLVDCEVVDVDAHDVAEAGHYFGQRWAAPSVEHLRETMRRVLVDRGEARGRGARARAEILDRFDLPALARTYGAVFEELGASAPDKLSRPRRRQVVVWEGDVFGALGFGTVARGLGRALLGTRRVDLRRVPGTAAPSDDPRLTALGARPIWQPDDETVTIRHAWPADFERPVAGKLVLYQPWEWGAFPRSWVEAVESVDELWVPSTFVHRHAVASGVPPERVAVVPHGVDVVSFHRGVTPLPLATQRRFRFLHVGGTIRRKGFDLLLRAYLDAFTAGDDVCLVVKDVGVATYYADQTLRPEVRRCQSDPDAPEILYLGEDMPEALLPSLYTACDCLVAPYRAEGYALAVPEAMACGLPVVVPDYGPCLDYCTAETAYLLPADVHHGDDSVVGDLETTGPPSWAEVDVPALAEMLRRVVREPKERRELGRRASDHVRRSHTWHRAADVAVERLEALAGRPAVVLAAPSRRRQPTLSGCTVVREAVRLGYPLEASILTYYPICDEVVLAYDPTSSDGTTELVHDLARRYPRIRPVPSAWSTASTAGGSEIARQTNIAFGHCTSDWLVYVQADEALHEDDRLALLGLLDSEDVAGGVFSRRSFAETLGTEIQRFRADGLLRLFRRGSARAIGDGMTCGLVAGERRRIEQTGFRLFDYGRIGSVDESLVRKRALAVFYHASSEAIETAIQDEGAQATVPFDLEEHPLEIRARLPVGAADPAHAPPLTLIVPVGPGEHAYVEPFANRLRNWYGDVVLLDDSRGDGCCEHLERRLAKRLPVTRLEWPVADDRAAAKMRAQERAASEWTLHVDIDELWDPRLLAAMPALAAALTADGRRVCAFPRANTLDGVLVNDLPREWWGEDGLRRAVRRGIVSRPTNRDLQPRLVHRLEPWLATPHAYPAVIARDPAAAATYEAFWIFHSKPLGRQQIQDALYAADESRGS